MFPYSADGLLSAGPFNPVSHCNYKAGNFIRLKIAADSAGYTDNRWCTYKQAEKQGWHIRKGEKGTLLEKWIFEEEKLVTDPDTGKTTKEKVQLSPPKCNYFLCLQWRADRWNPGEPSPS